MAQSVMDMVVNVQASGLSDFSKELRKAAEKSFDAINYAKMERGFNDVGKKFAKLIKDAVNADVNIDYKGLEAAATTYRKRMTAAAEEIARAEAKLRDKNITDAEAKLQRALINRTKAEMKAQQAIIDERLKGEQQVMDMAKEHVEFMKKGGREITKEIASGLEDAVDTFYSDLKSGNAKGIFSNLGKVSSSAGKKMANFGAAKDGQAGMMGKMAPMIGKMGKAIASVGAALGVVAATVGVIAAIGKVLLDANSQAKEMNREIVEMSAGAELFTGKMGNAEKALKNMRRFAIDNAYALKSSAKDTLKIMAAYQSGGVTFQEMAGDIEDAEKAQEGYIKATQIALTYSRLLGKSAQEVATDMGQQMEDLNLTLEGVASRFSSVTRQALESGFGVKRFFSMVLQATSGMSMYNVRLEEAGGLLLRIGKILGSKVGGDFLQQLGKGFVDESMKDRYKRVMLAGKGNTRTAFQLSAEDTAGDFQSRMLEAFKARDATGSVDTDKIADMQAAFSGVIDKDLMRAFATGDPDANKKVVEALGKMTPQQQAKALSSVRLNVADMGADGEALVRQFQNLISVSKGAEGNMSDMVKNIDALDMGGTLNMLFNSVESLFPGKEIYELSALQLAALEDATGISGEQLQQMRELSQGYHGNFLQLQELGKIQKEKGYSRDDQMKQIKAFGGYVNDSNQFIAATIDETTGDIIESGQRINLDDKKAFEQYVQSNSDAFGDAVKAGLRSEDSILQEEIAQNTFDVKQLLEMGTNWILERIAGGVGAIWGWITGESADQEAAEKAYEGMIAHYDVQREQANQTRQQIRDKERQLKKEDDPAKRREIEAELKQLRDTKEVQDLSSRAMRSGARTVRNIRSNKTPENSTDHRVRATATRLTNAVGGKEKPLEGRSRDFANIALQQAIENPSFMQLARGIAPITVGRVERDRRDRSAEITQRITASSQDNSNRIQKGAAIMSQDDAGMVGDAVIGYLDPLLGIISPDEADSENTQKAVPITSRMLYEAHTKQDETRMENTVNGGQLEVSSAEIRELGAKLYSIVDMVTTSYGGTLTAPSVRTWNPQQTEMDTPERYAESRERMVEAVKNREIRTRGNENFSETIMYGPFATHRDGTSVDDTVSSNPVTTTTQGMRDQAKASQLNTSSINQEMVEATALQEAVRTAFDNISTNPAENQKADIESLTGGLSPETQEEMNNLIAEGTASRDKLLETLTTEERQRYDKNLKERQKLEKDRRRYMEGRFAKRLAKEINKVDTKKIHDEQIALLASMHSSNPNQQEDNRAALASGDKNSAIFKWLNTRVGGIMGMGGQPRWKTLGLDRTKIPASVNRALVDDFIMTEGELMSVQPSGGFTRIRPNSADRLYQPPGGGIAGTKPGGPLAGRGGKTVIHIHNHTDEKRAYSLARRLMLANKG